MFLWSSLLMHAGLAGACGYTACSGRQVAGTRAGEAACHLHLLGCTVHMVAVQLGHHSGTSSPQCLRLLGPLVQYAPFAHQAQAAMPELPHQRRERYLGLGLSMYDVLVLSDDVGVATYFDGVLAAGAPPKPAANWVMGDVMAYCKVGGAAEAWGCGVGALVS